LPPCPPDFSLDSFRSLSSPALSAPRQLHRPPRLSPRRLPLSVLRPRSPPLFGIFNGFPAGGPMLRARKKIGKFARFIAILGNSPPTSSAWRRYVIPNTPP